MSAEAVRARGAKKRYNAPLRTEKARVTRERIRAVAEAGFLSDGYGRTSMASIAEAAGVAEKTVYLAFPTKAALLAEIVRAAVRGDGDGPPFVERQAWQRVLRAPDADLLKRFAEIHERVLHRAGRVLALAEAAAMADAELIEPRRRGHEAQRAICRQVANELASRGLLAGGMRAPEATDIIFALSSEDVYLRLVRERGWSRRRYANWLGRTLRRTLTAGYEKR